MTPEAPIRTPTLERYWHDPAFRAECDAERAAFYARAHASIDAAIARHRASKGQPA